MRSGAFCGGACGGWTFAAALSLACALVGCGANHRAAGGDSGLVGSSVGSLASGKDDLPESSAAQARVAELRQRFRTPEGSPVLGLGLVEALEPTDGGRLRPMVDAAARRAMVKPARVELPAHAADPVFLQDEQSHMAITFAIEGASAVKVAVAGGLAVYRAALQGADIVQRTSIEGSEDFIAFERRPAREELRYRVDVAGVAGLRLVANVLEFLDDEGTPRLHLAAPYVVDGSQEWHEADLAVDDCAVDTSPREPWGREVTRPGRQSCTVVVRWPAVRYPALVDPTWATTGSMANARAYHTASALWDGRLLVAGGSASTTLASAEIFDPATGTFGTTGSMTTARTGHAAAVLAGGDVFVAGGSGGSGYLASTEIFDPTTGIWTVGPSMAQPRVGHTATVILSGEILLVGGKSSSSTYLATAETYDPVANAWETNPQPTPSMVTARSGHAAVLLWNGKVLVTGGTATAAMASAEIYSPGAWGRTGSWTSGGSMATARYGHTASFLSTGFVLVAGGQTSATNWTATAELYDVTLGTWSSIASLTAARAGHTASVLSSGNVIIAGGVNNGTSPVGTEVFDETLHTWSAGGNLVAARYGHAAAVLGSSGVDDGPAVVTGGYDGTSYLSSAEVYGSNANGATCAQGTDCLSRYCVDGVCCNSACTGFCEACSLAKKGVGPDGTCAPINAGLDPDNECPEDAPTTCGQTGFCDGNGACQSYPKGTACGVICNGDLKQNMACDGHGACWSGSSIDCTPFTCAGGACKSACADYPDCASGYVCTASGTCVGSGDLGSPCTRPEECYSNYCIDGACCDTSCGGFCQACTAAKKSSGADGTCGMIAADHDPDGECASQTSCQGNTLLGASCNGSGACAAATTDCSPYVCSADACLTTCASDADCVAGFSCHDGVCGTGSGSSSIDAGTGGAGIADAGGGDAGGGDAGGSDAGGGDAGGADAGGADAGGSNASDSDAGGSGAGGSGAGGSGAGGGGAGGSAGGSDAGGSAGGSDAGGSDAGGGDAGGETGSSSSIGTTTTGTKSSTGGKGTTSGCGCAVPGSSSDSSSALLGLAALAAIGVRRRRGPRDSAERQ
jgi:Kelch motif/Galactose oxidase, central domain